MRGVAGTWNGKRPAQYERRQRKRRQGKCINCSNRVMKKCGVYLRRCASCTERHNREAREATLARARRR